MRQEEERRRNIVSKELPRLTERLRKQVSEWEEAHGQPFIVKGKRYLDVMDEEIR